MTSFIGRDEEIVALRHALTHTRLLTLTGAGGSGKTRLALALACTLVEDYRDGAWLIELAPLTDLALVEQAVAAVLGLQEGSRQSLREHLLRELRPRQIVLLLDNCEHLLPACRELIHALLQSCPSVTVVATSRAVLQVAGEQVWPVGPLVTPGTEERLAAMATALGDRSAVVLEECTEHLAYAGNYYYPFLWKLFKSHRKVIMRIPALLTFRSTSQDRRLEEAIAFLRTHARSTGEYLIVAHERKVGRWQHKDIPFLDLSWIPDGWWRLVTETQSRRETVWRVNRRYRDRA